MSTVVAANPGVVRDARPIIPRNETNLWTRAEELRDELYSNLEKACQTAGFEARLLKSPPTTYPAWVNFEAWQPLSDRATTQRSSVTITIEPKPWHTHPFELEVTYSARNKTRTYRRVVGLKRGEIDQIVAHLVGTARRPKLRRYRDMPYQLWRTRNKVEGLARDWLSFLGVGLAVITMMVLSVNPWIAAVFAVPTVAVFLAMRRRRWIVRNDGKPTREPRSLIRVDSWQAVVFDMAGEAQSFREKFLSALSAGIADHARFEIERVWYWGLDGKEEREQVVISARRGVVFCQIYGYGDDLYVGWDGHLNRGQWVEQTVSNGIDRASGDAISITRVVPGTQPTTDYDFTDLSCLMEWTHAQLVKLLKQLIAERRIDQEIDFKVQRAERGSVASRGAEANKGDTKGFADRARSMFQRTA